MKRKNPFAGKSNNTDSDINDIEDIAQELQKLEKELGKEEFNRLLDEAIRRYDELEDNHDEYLDDDEDLYDIDPVTVQEWKDIHPSNLTCASDSYYAVLATDICDIISVTTNYSKRMKTEEDIVKYGSNKKLYHKILASEKMFASSGYSFLKLHILSAVLSRFCPVRIIFAVEYN